MSEPRNSAETAVPVIEIRTFRLVPGGKEAFDRVAHRVVPMLERYRIRVPACEPSADSGDHYVLIRAFSSAAEATSNWARSTGATSGTRSTATPCWT